MSCAFESRAWVRFAFVRSAALQEIEKSVPSVHSPNVAPVKFAYERFWPERLAVLRSAPGQFVKWLAVGRATIVQPLIVVSAAAGVARPIVTPAQTKIAGTATAAKRIMVDE